MKKFYSFILLAIMAMVALQSQAAVYVLGNTPMGDWKLENALQMNEDGNDMYSLTVQGVGANCYFSIMLDNVSWDSQRGPQAQTAPTGQWEDASKAKGTWKTSLAGDYTIEYNAATQQARITVSNGEEPDRDGYFLIGAFNDWSTETQVPFVKDGDKYTLTYTFSGEFKIRDKSGDWFGGGHTFTANAPSATLADGDNFVIEAEAEYTLTIEDGVLTISGFGDAPEEVFESLWLKGSPNADWSDMVEVQFAQNDNNDWVIDNMDVPAGFEFKVVMKMDSGREIWLGAESDGNFWVDEETLGVDINILDGPQYQNLYFDKGGVFTFTINSDLTTLVVTGEFEDVPEPVYYYKIAMAPGGDWESMEELVFNEGETEWTLDNVEIAAGSEMKVIKVEVPTELDVPEVWHWLGAESDGNFWVTDEQLQKEIPLFEGAQYQNLYFENEGTFSFTFNADNSTLFIAKAEEDKGDLNGDGNVNTGDVSTLYQALLNGSNDPKFDLNGDGNVNTGDVSVLYMIILGTN